MAKIDFQNFTIPVGISKKRKQTGDARETIANLVYTRSMGIKAHHWLSKYMRAMVQRNFPMMK